jgi:hypothetical protein
MADELSRTLDTRVTIGNVHIGLLNRVIIDDVRVDDQSGKEMLKVARLSGTFNLVSLLKGKISLGSVQLFGFSARLDKPTPSAPLNCQFVFDALASKDTLKEKDPIDLRVNSLLIRRGKLAYHVLSEKETPGRFNPHHIQLQNIIGNISLKALSEDSLNVAVKRLSLDERESGFTLKKLSLKVLAGTGRAQVENFAIELPHTSLAMDTIHVRYDSLGAFNHFADRVFFSFRTRPSRVTPLDISPFVPALAHFKEPITLNMEAGGSLNQLNCPQLIITGDERNFRLRGDVTLQGLSTPSDAYLYGKLSELSATPRGVDFLTRNLSGAPDGVSPTLQNLGNVGFRGEVSGYFSDLVTYGLLHTDLGDVQTDLKLSADKEKGTFAYSGSIQTKEFDLGKMTGNGKAGNITFNLDVNGRHDAARRYPDITLKGLVAALEYSDYTYENITLDGSYQKGGFSGKMAMQDPNGSFYLDGQLNVATRVPTFNFRAALDKVRPHALNLTATPPPDAELSVKMKADFTGASIGEMEGTIDIDSLDYVAGDKSYFMRNLNMRATRQDGENHLRLTSEFMTASLDGDYHYPTLPASLMAVIRKHLPSLARPSKRAVETRNDFRFDINVYDTKILTTLFDIPLEVYSHSTLKGYFSDPLQRLRVEGYFPRMRYKNNYIESGVLLCETPGDYMRARLRFTRLKNDGAVNIALDAQAKDDQVSTTLNWGNSGAATYSGQLAAVANFLREAGEKPPLKAVVDIKPTDVILNDTLWKVHPSRIVVDSGRIDINNFHFSHNDRYVRVDGRLSKRLEDSVKIDLKDINMGYVFDIANISSDVDFEGDATGMAYASGVLEKPMMNTRLFVRNLSLNKGRLGDLNIYGEWDNEHRAIHMDGYINDIDPRPAHVTGYVQPLKPESGLDLHIEAYDTNLKFLEHYMSVVANDIRGRGTGNVRLYGKFKELNVEGTVVANASMKFDVLNTRFGINDTIRMSPTGLTFDHVRITDAEGHAGTMDGYLRFKHFKDLNYRFEIRANNMLVMNTKETTEVPFYGTVYGTGNAVLSGDAIHGLEVNAAMTTNRNTVFNYINGSVASAISNQFIKFVDKTPRRALPDSTLLLSHFDQMRQRQQEGEEERHTDIRLNILVDATPDATMKIIMDPIAGDYISGKGTGNIRTEFYNKGDVKMFGSYRISQGIYKFSLQEVIRKDFVIQDGSTISFNGPPLDANMDIRASYTVNSASLNDLIPGATAYTQQPNVRVNCIMNLTGAMVRPAIKMNIELPNEKDEVQTLVRNYISTQEQMNMQILYLLGIGKFYTEEARTDNQNSNVMSSVLSSTLSGQLNNALSQVFDTNNNWNFGTNLSTGDKGWTDVEVEGILSAQLLNNRLLINGNFGYRDNPMANTNFVGDFEAEWLVNRSGEIRLKAYNETNDRYYTKTNLTTQGVGIMFKKDFDKWNELLFWNKWKLRNKRKREVREKAKNEESKELRMRDEE